MNETELSALIVSIIREFGGVVLITVVVIFAIVYSVFKKFFGD